MGNLCPFMKKDCVEQKCKLWIHLVGTNPQTGQPTDDWGCAIGWLPLLLVENSRHQRGTQKAVESLRNETIKAVSGGFQGLISVAENKKIGGGQNGKAD